MPAGCRHISHSFNDDKNEKKKKEVKRMQQNNFKGKTERHDE